MQPGRRIRNFAVGVGYVLAAPVVIVSLPILVGWGVTTNYRGAATRLAGLPGVSPDGGVRAGVVAGAYGFVLWGLVLAGGTGLGGLGGTDSADEAPATADGLAGTDGNEEPSDEEIITLYETVLKQSGVDVRTVERDSDVLYVEYYPTSSITGEIPDDVDDSILEEMGYVAGGYVGAIEEGLTTERMEVTILDPDDGGPTAHWAVETEWASAYHAGEISMDDVADRAFETVEHVDD